MLLGFKFDGNKKTLWLEHEKRDKLLHRLHQWLRLSHKQNAGIPFDEFQLVISKNTARFHGITCRKWTDVAMQFDLTASTSAGIPPQ
jgi:hypothetical protein